MPEPERRRSPASGQGAGELAPRSRASLGVLEFLAKLLKLLAHEAIVRPIVERDLYFDRSGAAGSK